MNRLPIFASLLLAVALAASWPMAARAAETKPDNRLAWLRVPTWQEAMLALRALGPDAALTTPTPPGVAPKTKAENRRGAKRTKTPYPPGADRWYEIEKAFALESDWLLQDLKAAGYLISAEPSDRDKYPARWFTDRAEPDIERKLIAHVLDELGPQAGGLRGELDQLAQKQVAPHTRPWLDLYVKACQKRRDVRLAAMLPR